MVLARSPERQNQSFEGKRIFWFSPYQQIHSESGFIPPCTKYSARHPSYPLGGIH